MNPRKLEYVRDGYKQKIKQIDALNWMNGQYTMSAVAVAIEANFAKNPKGKYMKKVYADPSLDYSEDEKFNIPEDFEPCNKMESDSIIIENGIDDIFQ